VDSGARSLGLAHRGNLPRLRPRSAEPQIRPFCRDASGNYRAGPGPVCLPSAHHHPGF
jgi:hypothetical protein